LGEHALILILACLRHVSEQARTPGWLVAEPELLEGKQVTLLGAGDVATSLVRFLKAADCDITVLRRASDNFPAATRTLSVTKLQAVLPNTDILVLALTLTAENKYILGAKELALLPQHAVLVNVARGSHVDTSALVEALNTSKLAAAGLDVTDPEPLPGHHPLWSMKNVLITSHCADSPAYVTKKLVERVEYNVIRFRNDEPLAGVVDLVAGY
jgi:phosphoglycerate dehydrogenase-like enzyme